MQDRRRFMRWQIDRQARVKLEASPAFTDCHLKDISLKGTQISLEQKLEKDKFLRLNLALSKEFTLDIEVWVAWHKSVDGHNVYGLYFAKIKDNDKEKIYQFIRRYFPQEINKQWWRGLTEEKGGEIMPKPRFEDRRIFERLPVKFSLRFLDLNSNREGQGQIRDISAKGVGFMTNLELVPRAPLEMWLEIPDKREPLYTRGEVIWSKLQDVNEYRAGVNLEKADLMGLSRVLRV